MGGLLIEVIVIGSLHFLLSILETNYSSIKVMNKIVFFKFQVCAQGLFFGLGSMASIAQTVHL